MIRNVFSHPSSSRKGSFSQQELHVRGNYWHHLLSVFLWSQLTGNRKCNYELHFGKSKSLMGTVMQTISFSCRAEFGVHLMMVWATPKYVPRRRIGIQGTLSPDIKVPFHRICCNFSFFPKNYIVQDLVLLRWIWIKCEAGSNDLGLNVWDPDQATLRKICSP